MRLADRGRPTGYIPFHLTDLPATQVLKPLVFHMSLPNHPALQRLRRLDGSLPGFSDRLSDFLYGEEYQRCVYGEDYQQRVLNLQDDDLAWLVDHIDNARAALPFLSTSA